jgi:hypothetical protein
LRADPITTKWIFSDRKPVTDSNHEKRKFHPKEKRKPDHKIELRSSLNNTATKESTTPSLLTKLYRKMNCEEHRSIPKRSH